MAQMNLSTKQTHRHREQICGCQGGREEGVGWDGEIGAGRCKLLHLEQINNEFLLYSTGNYIQSLGIESDEGSMGKIIYVYMTGPLCCIA